MRQRSLPWRKTPGERYYHLLTVPRSGVKPLPFPFRIIKGLLGRIPRDSRIIRFIKILTQFKTAHIGVCPKRTGVCPGFAHGLPRGLPRGLHKGFPLGMAWILPEEHEIYFYLWGGAKRVLLDIMPN